MSSRLYAISDLHIGAAKNRAFLETLSAHPSDWLIVAGDVGETEEHLTLAWEILLRRFARIIWTPGNHELWSMPGEAAGGQAKYERLVALCRRFGVLTPEDPYPLFESEGGACCIAPTFVLYDYGFRPDNVSLEQAVPWAVASGVLCTDERLLRPEPYPTRQAWCVARLAATEPRLAAAAAEHPLVIVNHFPLRFEMARTPYIPRFSIWCGTPATEEWHTRYRARVVVSGHLHIRSTAWRDNVRFEEVSLGNPGQWDKSRSADSYLRQIL